jgi:integrase/recombinase XerD
VTHCRQLMLEELQRRNFAPTTISSYLHAVEQFARHFKCRPDRLNQTHFRVYQAYLLRERKMRPLTVRLHVAALRFFFVKTLKRRHLLDDTPYPKAPRRLPQILSVEEVARLIDAAHSLSHRTMLMVLYSTGMRNAELRHVQVADIDSRRMLIHIQRGKGGRDRYVPLSPTLLTTHVGGLREAALWQPRPRAALPRAVHPPRRDFQSPARRRHGRHSLVSVEGLSAREPDSHPDARRQRIPPALPPARPAETLRPHPLLRPAGAPVPHPRSGDVSHRLGGRPATTVTTPSVGSTPMRSWPCPRCGAPMRIVERLTPRQLFLAVLLADFVYDSS